MKPPKRFPTPDKRYGQHFLHDPNILATIVDKAGVNQGDRVLEIGPGPGGLTRALLDRGATVWAVELDPRMTEHLRNMNMDGLTILQADALKVDYPALAAEAGSKLKLVANLPYQISGPLLARLLRQRAAFASITVMLQREVAERIAAAPGTKARGSLSVMCECFCRAKIVMKVAPGSFHPPPKVESRVVRLDLLEDAHLSPEQEDLLWLLARAGFSQRRKMIRNTLKTIVPALDSVLETAKLKGTERAEALSLDNWLALVSALS